MKYFVQVPRLSRLLNSIHGMNGSTRYFYPLGTFILPALQFRPGTTSIRTSIRTPAHMVSLKCLSSSHQIRRRGYKKMAERHLFQSIAFVAWQEYLDPCIVQEVKPRNSGVRNKKYTVLGSKSHKNMRFCCRIIENRNRVQHRRTK